MKNVIIGLFTACLFAGCATTPSLSKSPQENAANEPSLRLKLEPEFRTLRLGQSQRLRLNISGADIDGIVKPQEGIDVDLRPRAFEYEFKFNPQREGLYTLGPYYIEVNGQKLESNQISINVLPKWNGTVGTYFQVDTSSIALGESIELVIETWRTENEDTVFPVLVRNDSFSSKIGRNISSSLITHGEERIIYSRISWLITPKTVGKFKINRDLFEKFPKNVDPPNFEIEVAETN